jgi:hypothetical protein
VTLIEFRAEIRFRNCAEPRSQELAPCRLGDGSRQCQGIQIEDDVAGCASIGLAILQSRDLTASPPGACF